MTEPNVLKLGLPEHPCEVHKDREMTHLYETPSGSVHCCDECAEKHRQHGYPHKVKPVRGWLWGFPVVDAPEGSVNLGPIFTSNTLTIKHSGLSTEIIEDE